MTNYESGTVSKINLATDRVVGSINVGPRPEGLAINPAGTFAYVSALKVNVNTRVAKINLTTDTIVSEIFVGESGPEAIAINPAGTFAYVVNAEFNLVQKISLVSDAVVASIKVGENPLGLAINSAGTFAYVTNSDSNTVSKINLATDRVVATISVGSRPWSVAINPAGTFAYVTNASPERYSPGTVSKISLTTDKVVETISVGLANYGVAINPAGTFAYVTDGWGGSVSKFAIQASDSQSVILTLGKSVAARSIAKYAKISVASTSKVSLKVGNSYLKYCRVSGMTLKGVKVGTCKVTVIVTPKRGKAISKVVTLKVTK